MTKKEFMDQLARLLGGLSQSERQEALDYYNSYFDDAGPENEAAVIQELGSPGKVAAIIKADLADEGEDFGEYTEKGFQDTRSQEEGQMPEMFQKQDRRSRGDQVRRRRDHSNLILIILLAIVAVPVVLGVGGGILGGILGVAGGIVGLVAGLFAGTVAFLFGGVAVIVAGIIKCFTAPALGLAATGIGFLMVAGGLLLAVLFAWLVGVFTPWLIRKIVDFCQKHLDNRKKGAQKV